KTERKTRSTHTASDRFQKNSAMCLANYGLPPLRGKLIGASLAVLREEVSGLRWKNCSRVTRSGRWM
ncbi:hypothetical protein NLO85_27635, partial [Pseudomonas savastanoi]